jgi:thiol-disulfide isomerase/thioredoxin
MNKILNILLVLLVIAYVAYYFYKKPKYINGEIAPPFTAQMIDGTEFSLNDMKGKYVLLDFWGSWCGPCRKENPSIVQLYNDFNGKQFKDASGFEVVSVAIENNEKRMKNAIAKDGLRWKYHIPQLDRFKSPIVKDYGVNEIPTKYLINPEGYIMGVNQKPSEIERLLKERMK